MLAYIGHYFMLYILHVMKLNNSTEYFEQTNKWTPTGLTKSAVIRRGRGRGVKSVFLLKMLIDVM